VIDIVIPMAGLGTRLSTAGMSQSKPLIEVMPGRLMIDYVIDFLSFTEPHRFIFVCLAEHDRLFGISRRLRNKAPGCEVVLAEGLTAGPASSALLAAPLLRDDAELLIAYCDSFLTIEAGDFVRYCRDKRAQGGLITYPSSGAFESYAVVTETGEVVRTAEKQVISSLATAGIYYFAAATDFVRGAQAMIARSARDAGEFFVCPVFNALIAEGKRVCAYPIARDQRIEMGTPDALATSRDWLAREDNDGRSIDAA
jgi:NDP-sugar pyrophosphorylase family protein